MAIETPGGIFGTIDRRRVERVFLDLLSAIENEGRTVSENSHSPTYAARIFAQRPDCEGYQKIDFESAMERLFVAGKIRVENYGDRPSRQFKRIVETDVQDNE